MNKKSRELIKTAFDIAKTSDEVINRRPWMFREYAPRWAELGELELALEAAKLMGQVESVHTYTDTDGDHEERERTPVAATLAEVAYYFLEDGQKEKALQIVQEALVSLKSVKEEYIGNESIRFMTACARMKEYAPSIDFGKLEELLKDIKIAPLGIMHAVTPTERYFENTPIRLVRQGRYQEALAALDRCNNYVYNGALMQVKESAVIEMLLAAANRPESEKEQLAAFMKSLAGQVNWDAEADVKADRQKMIEAIDKDVGQMLAAIGRDISWVKATFPVYFIKYMWTGNTLDRELWAINANGSGLRKICDGAARELNISPDGKYLLMSIYRDQEDKSGSFSESVGNNRLKWAMESVENRNSRRFPTDPTAPTAILVTCFFDIKTEVG